MQILSAKIFGSTDSVPGGKYQAKPKMLFSKHKSKLLTKNILTKISKFLNGSLSSSNKLREIKEKCWKIFHLLKKSWNLEEMFRIHFFQGGSKIQIRICIKMKWILGTALLENGSLLVG